MKVVAAGCSSKRTLTPRNQRSGMQTRDVTPATPEPDDAPQSLALFDTGPKLETQRIVSEQPDESVEASLDADEANATDDEQQSLS